MVQLVRPRKQFLQRAVLMCLVMCCGKECLVSPEHVPLTTSVRKNALAPTTLHLYPSLPSFPRSVGRCPLTLVALHNLQRITGTNRDQRGPGSKAASLTLRQRRLCRCHGKFPSQLCCSKSTGTTPREDQAVHFSLDESSGICKNLHKFLTARSCAGTLKQLMPLSDVLPH